MKKKLMATIFYLQNSIIAAKALKPTSQKKEQKI